MKIRNRNTDYYEYKSMSYQYQRLLYKNTILSYLYRIVNILLKLTKIICTYITVMISILALKLLQVNYVSQTSSVSLPHMQSSYRTCITYQRAPLIFVSQSSVPVSQSPYRICITELLPYLYLRASSVSLSHKAYHRRNWGGGAEGWTSPL